MTRSNAPTGRFATIADRQPCPRHRHSFWFSRRDLSLGWVPGTGLDLAGGLSVVYKPATHASTADMQEVVTILTDRVDGLGVLRGDRQPPR